MLTNEDKYRIVLNKITERLGTKSRCNEDEKYVLSHVQDVLIECHPEIDWWWQKKSLLTKWGASFVDVLRGAKS